jgi:hypothetical protein
MEAFIEKKLKELAFSLIMGNCMVNFSCCVLLVEWSYPTALRVLIKHKLNQLS